MKNKALIVISLLSLFLSLSLISGLEVTTPISVTNDKFCTTTYVPYVGMVTKCNTAVTDAYKTLQYSTTYDENIGGKVTTCKLVQWGFTIKETYNNFISYTLKHRLNPTIVVDFYK